MDTDQGGTLSDARVQEAFAALATRVKQLRYGKGWGPDELAGRAKISRTALYQIENGRTEQPRAGTVRRLARALGVDPAELLQARVSGVESTLKGAMSGELDLGSERSTGEEFPTQSFNPAPVPPAGVRSDGPLADGGELESVPPWLRSLDLERKFRRLLDSPLREAVSRIVEESYRLLPPEPFDRTG